MEEFKIFENIKYAVKFYEFHFKINIDVDTISDKIYDKLIRNFDMKKYGNLKTYIYKCARNAVFNEIRHIKIKAKKDKQYYEYKEIDNSVSSLDWKFKVENLHLEPLIKEAFLGNIDKTKLVKKYGKNYIKVLKNTYIKLKENGLI